MKNFFQKLHNNNICFFEGHSKRMIQHIGKPFSINLDKPFIILLKSHEFD